MSVPPSSERREMSKPVKDMTREEYRAWAKAWTQKVFRFAEKRGVRRA